VKRRRRERRVARERAPLTAAAAPARTFWRPVSSRGRRTSVTPPDAPPSSARSSASPTTVPSPLMNAVRPPEPLAAAAAARGGRDTRMCSDAPFTIDPLFASAPCTPASDSNST
jgi:hypothetical protein